MRLLAAVTLSAAGLLGSCSDMRSDENATRPADSAGTAASQPSPTGGGAPADIEGTSPMTNKVVKTDEEWRAMLTEEQYRITRLKGTERPFTGAYWNTKVKGTYFCVGCGQALFNSDTKYDSGCGWPSFWAPIEGEHVDTEADSSLGMQRTEILCSRCGAHLGHVFDDGPNPTGLRYCVNSASLKLIEDE